MSKMISVIVPVYNVENYLKECLDSLINQTFKDYEIIIVDDGSTDKSSEIYEKYTKKYDNVIAYKKKNGGLSDARNFGVEKSNGKYIIFVDSDDYVDKDFLLELYKIIEENNVSISMCHFLKFNDGELVDEKDNSNVIETGEIITRDEVYERLLSPNISSLYETGTSKLIEKKYMKEIKFPVGLVHEDTATTYKIYSKFEKVGICNKKMYYYRQRNNSIMHIFNKKRLSMVSILKERQSFFEKIGNEKLAVKHFKYMIKALCRLRLDAKSQKELYIEINTELKKILNESIIFKKLSLLDKVKIKFLVYLDNTTNIILKMKRVFK